MIHMPSAVHSVAGPSVYAGPVLEALHRPQAPPRLTPALSAYAAESVARRVVANFWQFFSKMSLVFGCIGADLCN